MYTILGVCRDFEHRKIPRRPDLNGEKFPLVFCVWQGGSYRPTIFSFPSSSPARRRNPRSLFKVMPCSICRMRQSEGQVTPR
jgi:hypothetical protein